MNNNKVFVIPHFDRENFQVYERNTLFRLVLLKNNFLERERERERDVKSHFRLISSRSFSRNRESLSIEKLGQRFDKKII